MKGSIVAKLKVGQSASDYQFNTLAGEPIALSDTWRKGNHTLLIFLRHLA